MSMDVPVANEIQTGQRDNRPGGPLVARVIILIMSALALGFLGGVWLSNARDSKHNDEEFQIFWQSWDVLEDEFYYDLPEDPDLIRGALQGLLGTTGDPYTFLVSPTQAEFDRQSTAGEFGGIGAYVNQNSSGQLIITTPFNGFPAEEAGLMAGDVVRAIDGTSIAGWALDDAVGLLRGEIGSEVTLTIYRPADDREFDVDVKRAQIELPTVYSTVYGDVGYVRLFSFNSKATELLDTEISAMVDGDVQALILDLRGNPGGLLNQAISVADLFLDEGLVLTQRNRNDNAVEYYSKDGQIAEDVPLVVLIDGGSASASEVVSGALRDRDRAILIGQTSYGKGSVQHVYDLSDGSQLHLTVSLWFTPNETPIQGQGLTPDVKIEASNTADEDTVLNAALGYFAEQGMSIEGPVEEPDTVPESE